MNFHLYGAGKIHEIIVIHCRGGMMKIGLAVFGNIIIYNMSLNDFIPEHIQHLSSSLTNQIG